MPPSIRFKSGQSPRRMPKVDIIGVATDVTLAPASIVGQSFYASTDTDWVNPAYALVDDATAATFTMPDINLGSSLLKFGFTPTLPLDAKITGVEVRVRMSATGLADVRQVYLTMDGTICNMEAYTPANAVAADTLTTVTLGGPGYTFGTTLSAADLNAGRIGVAVRCGRTGSARVISLQYVDMKLYYTTLEGLVTRGAATATAALASDGTGISPRRHRFAFPVGMGTPTAIIWASTGMQRSSRANYLARDTTVASAYVNFGMATPAQALGGVTTMNNAETFVSQNCTKHMAISNPDIGGVGTLTTYNKIIGGGVGSTFANPVAWGDGYVDFEMTQGTARSPFIVTVTAIYAQSAHLYGADGFVSGSPTQTRDVTCGFRPNLFLTMCIPDAYDTADHGAYAEVQFGGGKWNGTGWDNYVASWNASTVIDDGAGDPIPRDLVENRLELLDDASKYSNNINDPLTGVEGLYSDLSYKQRLTARSATGYTIENMLDANADEDNVTVLALDMGSIPFEFRWLDMPAATGLDTVATDFRPSAMVAALTSATALGRFRDVDVTTESFGLFQASDVNAATHGWASANGVNPLAASRLLDIEGARVVDAALTTTFAAKVARMRNTGVELDVTATPGARKALGLFIG